MTPHPAPAVPIVAFTGQPSLTPAEAEAFRHAGLLVIRGLIQPDELAAVQAETLPLVEAARTRAAQLTSQPERLLDLYDTAYLKHAQTGAFTPFRIEYMIAKSAAARRLMAHPFILRTVAMLQGADFTSTWDSMVFKSPGGGAIIPWHRDSGDAVSADAPVFNVDFYLDASDLTNCVWGMAGTNRWTAEQARTEIERRNQGGGFLTDGAEPLPMNPGDVMLHDILALHGSPWAQSQLRRVLYYEFRAAKTILETKTHNAQYCRRKQRMLKAIIEERAAHAVGAGEMPYDYRPTTPEPLPDLPAGWRPHTWQYPHDDYSEMITMSP
jgi:phytanoyl-CoA hydroxylase